MSFSTSHGLTECSESFEHNCRMGSSRILPSSIKILREANLARVPHNSSPPPGKEKLSEAPLPRCASWSCLHHLQG